jgi:hypothetical protein
MKTAVRMVDLCMHGLPYQRQRPDGNTHHPDVYSCLPISVFWKEIFQPVEHRKASGHVAEKSKWMSSGWMMLGQFSVRTEYHVIQTDSRDPIFRTWNLSRIF